jgi:hypothetical protein
MVKNPRRAVDGPKKLKARAAQWTVVAEPLTEDEFNRCWDQHMDETLEAAAVFLKAWKGEKEARGVYVSLDEADRMMRHIWPDLSQEDGIKVLQRLNYSGGPVSRVLP